MSNRYKGAVISATPPTTTGGESGTASGAWTLEQQMQAQAAGLWPSPPPPNFIEDVFSTYLYTGTGAAQTINNGINLSGKGGLVWLKNRNSTQLHWLFDTVRGKDSPLSSTNTDSVSANVSNYFGGSNLCVFNSNGFTANGAQAQLGTNNNTYASWTFREQSKFFDVVTYTGDGVSGRTVAHNLGSEPGFILVKLTSSAGSGWQVWHRYDGVTAKVGLLETTDDLRDAAYSSSPNLTFLRFAPTASDFTLKAGIQSDANACNAAGETYVAYLFAHNAGGFGLTGTDNVITCGSYTTVPGSPVNVNLGYEPQWLLVRRVTPGGAWFMFDIMRGFTYTDTTALLANSSGAEFSYGTSYFKPTATGFTAENGFFGGTSNIIYIAIRRGPMKVPTVGTSVYMGATRTGNGAVTALTAAGFPPDLYWAKSTAAVRDHAIFDRLRGPLPLLSSNNTQNEIAYSDDLKSFDMTGVTTGTDGSTNAYNQNGVAYVNWYMRRAPSFFDEVCYTGTGVATTQAHNLAAVPELMIVKRRNLADYDWYVYSSAVGATKFTVLNSTATPVTATNAWNNTSPTSAVFTLGTAGEVNGSGGTYVAYLFATCAGVSKVGSYTGNGTTQTINCGFTGGARFVLIKATSTTGDWMVSDSARGIVSGNDPYLELNNTNAEVTGEDWLDTNSTGFVVNEVSGSNANTNGVTYIFLAIA